jgi:hypothetical protein
VTENDKFCSNCGQKSTDGKISLHDLFHEFVHTWLHVDGKFFSTALHLFVPGKLTVEFFKGRHKRYAHPVQLFFLLTVLSLALTAWALKDSLSLVKAQSEASKTKAIAAEYKLDLKTTFDSVTRNRPTLAAWSDSVLVEADTIFGRKIDAKLQKMEQQNNAKSGSFVGGIFTGISLGSKNSKKDSLKALTDTVAAKYLLSPEEQKVFTVIRKIKFKKSDLLLSSDEELVEKYQLKTATDLKGRAIIRAIAHIMQRGGDFVGYLMSKMLWISIFTIPFLGWALLLLYRGQRRFYVEHIVFLCHWFAFSAVTSIFSSFLIKNGFGLSSTLLSSIAPFVYLYFAMKAFYKEGWGETFARFFVFLFAYAIFMIVFSIIGLFVSAVFF